MRMTTEKIFGRLALIAGLFFAWAIISCESVFAAGGLSLHTDYPGVAVQPGDTLSITVDFDNESGSALDADVAVASVPDGWDAYLQGGSYQVSRVHVPSGTESASMTLRVTVPGELDGGSYPIVVTADAGEGISANLELSFTVTEKNAGAGSFTSEYPSQEGALGTTFSFSTTLVNNDLKTQSYSLSANAPAGWTVSFAPSGESTKVAAIEVEAGASQGLTVTVVPPESVSAGEFIIPCSAVSADETLSTELSVNVTGTYGLLLQMPDGRLSFDANAGKTSDVTLQVTNTGNVDLENISINASAPSGWTVTYEGLDENQLSSVAAGATAEVIAHVKPSSDAITGDYVTSFSAKTTEASSSADFRVSVKTETYWGIVAIAVILVVIGGVGYVFHKYGRR